MSCNQKVKWGRNSIVETTLETVPVTRFEAPHSDSSYEFVLGNILKQTQRLFIMTNTDVTCERAFKCDNFIETNTDMIFKRTTVEFMRFNIVAGGLNESLIYEADEGTQNAL